MNILEKYPILQLVCLRFFILVYQLHRLLWIFVFTIIGRIVFVYHVENDKSKNITLNYYLGYNMNKYKNGCYYLKICDINGTNSIAFVGNLDNIKLDIFGLCKNENPPKRKTIILYNHEKIISFDLEILDNYFTNSKQCKNDIKPIKNLGKILKIFGITCTHIVVIQLYPFKKEQIEPDKIDIEYLYF
jgi:hypothetical protein